MTRMAALLWLASLASMFAHGAQAQQALPAPPVPPATAAAERERPDAPANQPSTPASASAKFQIGAAASQPSAAAAASAQFQSAPPPQIEPAPPPGDAAPTDPALIFPPAPPPIFAEPGTATTAPALPPPSAASSETRATPPPPAACSPSNPVEHPWSLGAAIGAGATFDHTVGGANPLGFGFGLRGEYRLHDEWSIGARALIYVGGSSELPTGKVSMSSWLMAAEASYVIDFAPVLVQPGLALGLMQRERKGPLVSTLPEGTGFVPGSESSTRYGFYVAPGVTVTLPLGKLLQQLDLLFVAVDARLDLVFGSRVSSNVQLLLLAGIRF